MSGSKLSRNHKYALATFTLLALFVMRVLGQLLVACDVATFLPPMEQWQSGLLPYPYLLTAQLAIIALMFKICRDLWINTGYFARQHPKLGRFALSLGPVYLAFTVLRYTLNMALYPRERWFGGSIPVIFHCVLAAFVILIGKYHGRTLPPLTTPQRRAVHAFAAFALSACLIHHLAPTKYPVVEGNAPRFVEVAASVGEFQANEPQRRKLHERAGLTGKGY